ncbi:hypothetical protein GS399_02465 [Pedobacter sp. HMF7647]|uniref:PNPLA domain-containing protein n=1 Tax=Hufsiella arboris TaxID=2695275 RepID=A0A7K1Y6Z0_9SPHI|nr:patatin-like phospholipase family protein [Hufsiella arboris]MXV49818.1 hypothetical protein [Hufsiella arboris]
MTPKQLTPQQQQAYDNLKVDKNNRLVLSLDGGGVRGILTLQLLKKIEEIAGIPCFELFDLVAGTSTGGIIAGLISSGKTAVEIESLYKQFVSKVFLKRGILANQFLNPPAYDKKNFRSALKALIGNITLEEAHKTTGVDLLITAKDVTDNEETFFTCFENNGTINGTYKDALLRTVMEATMSAPTYFHPLERFIDGGTTTYNNPTTAAFLEAVCYSGSGKYVADNMTIFSMGTGRKVQSVTPERAAEPKGLDAYFWLMYVMDESGQDASSMQSDIFRSGFLKTDFRRFQISLDTFAIHKIPDRDIKALNITNADWLSELTMEELSAIQMDDVSKFDLLTEIGQAMVEYIMIKNKFTRDLNDTPSKRDELVTAFNGVPQIKPKVKLASWIDSEPS